jgi:hypothetical protein
MIYASIHQVHFFPLPAWRFLSVAVIHPPETACFILITLGIRLEKAEVFKWHSSIHKKNCEI